MGVLISAISVGKFICHDDDQVSIQEFEDKHPEIDTVCVYSLDFAPINHLPMYQIGWYEFIAEEKTALSMSYFGYNKFRKAICKPIHGDWLLFCQNVEDGKILPYADFAEMLYFADNEGCFDYSIADKLLGDFIKHRDTIMPTLDECMQEEYDNYINILQECVNCRGVVWYR